MPGVRRKHFQDVVLGTIEIPEPYLDVVDTPVFQRLRRLEQLGPASLVYPTATHSRFSHSLGVFTLAVRAFDTLEQQIDDPEFSSAKQLFCKAALLHDIGHYPLSHTLESAYSDPKPETKPVEPVIEKDASGTVTTIDLSKPAAPAVSAVPAVAWIPGDDELLQAAAAARRTKGWSHHESIAGVVINSDKWGLRDFFDNEEERVSAARMIEGKPAQGKYGALLMSLIHGVVDVDRLDYLLRDSASLGSSYGGIEVNRILGQLHIEKDAYATPYVAFPRKAVAAVDHYLTSRYAAYQAIAFHPVATAFDVLARAAYWLMLRKPDCAFPRSTAEYRAVAGGEEVKGRAPFLRVTDDMFWDSVRKMYDEERATEKGEDSLCFFVSSALLERKPPSVVYELAASYKTRWRGYVKDPNTGEHTLESFDGNPGHWNLVWYRAERQRVLSAFETVRNRLGLRQRVFWTEQTISPYSEGKNPDWTQEHAELPPGSLLLHDVDGPKTFESLRWGLGQELATMETAFLRVYAAKQDAKTFGVEFLAELKKT